MTLHQLKIWTTIARRLSITKAAAELRIKQPSVSQQIKLLEKEFGLKLYNVNRRGIEELERRNNELVEQIQRLKMAQLYVPPQPRTVVISTVRTLRHKKHTRAHRRNRRIGKAVSIHRPHLPRDRRSASMEKSVRSRSRPHGRSGHTHR